MSKTKKNPKMKVEKTAMQIIQDSDNNLKTASHAGETQFDVAMYYWDHRNPKQAEKWLRYASHEGHELAQGFLKLGIELGFFFTVGSQINSYAIEILEYFISPQPNEIEIKNMEIAILKHLTKEYGLREND